MLRQRIIPCLLLSNGGLVKTKNFKDPKYIGDPLNAVRIFNEKKADEIIILDISATSQNTEPDYALIEKIAQECRMPLCYGGGIKSVKQAKRILSLGVEKISMSFAVISDPSIVSDLALEMGRQSVVVTVDFKKKRFSSGYDIYTHNGNKKSRWDVLEFLDTIQSQGVGEVIINSIGHDGMMEGYEIGLINQLKDLVKVPLTVLGGAGSIEHISNLISKNSPIGASAGSLFVFKGRFRSVLINYPSPEEKRVLNRRKNPILSG